MPSDAAGAGTASAVGAQRGFLAWYRRYYLLLNLPLLFLITELALTRIDLVNRWPFNEKDDLAKAFAGYAARPPAPGDRVVLLLGNSATDRGFDAQAIERALGQPGLHVYNFGLKGARLDDQLGLIDVALARGVRPTDVVIGVNSYLIDHEVAVDTLYPWLERRTPYAYFHRSRIRTKLWRWLKSLVGLEHKKLARSLDTEVPDGRTPESAIRAFLDEFGGRAPADYPMIDQLPVVLDQLARRGIRGHAIVLPMAASGTRRYAEYGALVGAIRARVPAASLDLSGDAARFTDDLFYDVGHTNKAGRAALTQAVIPWLRQQLLGAPGAAQPSHSGAGGAGAARLQAGQPVDTSARAARPQAGQPVGTSARAARPQAGQPVDASASAARPQAGQPGQTPPSPTAAPPQELRP